MAQLIVNTTIGKVAICGEDGKITALLFSVQEGAKSTESALLLSAATQLQEYLDGCRRSFSLPLAPRGSEFQLAVWRELEKIEYGQTLSYGMIAAAIGNPKAARAVGMANHCNPLPIFIPCHRVIGANGKLTGYAGGVELKAMLLELERKNQLK